MIFNSADYAWAVAIGILVIYEVVAYFLGWPLLSSAVWIATRSQYGPVIPFIVGFMCGHFFWSGQ